ncbi:MAG: MFS transporter [Alphaproteobacteria bacterium]|nr:MFS transporter [Alphaproteobacteria bacterium]
MPQFSFSVLRLRDFRLLLVTRMGMMMALQAQAVIVGWQVYSITKDPFLLGLTGLVEAVPAIFCALFAGHVVDISHPQRVYMMCIGTLALNSLLLMIVAGGYAPMDETHVLYFIFAGVFVSGLARSFAMPAAFSILPKIVPRKEFPAATAWQSSMFQIGAISGPAIAGLIYGGYGPHGAWLFPVSVIGLAFLMASFMRLPSFERDTARPKAFESIREGWAFILGNKTLLTVMAIDMFAVLFGGAVAMLPAFADQVLHVGAEGLGALRAAPAMGAIVTALIFALRPMKTISAQRLLLVVTGFGICMIGFGLSEYFWLSMLFLALSGAFDSVSMIIRGTMMQLLTPDRMRGRVAAVNSMFIISSNEIGAFESGVAAKLFGLVPSVVIGGVGTLIVVATAALSKDFRRKVVKAED